jgi:hypothetical protein
MLPSAAHSLVPPEVEDPTAKQDKSDWEVHDVERIVRLKITVI